MARRRGADSAQTWDALVSAARSTLRENGHRGLALRSVAGRAGVTLGTLQYYFPTRAALVETLLGEAFARAVRELAAGLGQSPSSLARAVFRQARQHRGICQAGIAGNLEGMAASSRAALEQATRAVQALAPGAPREDVALTVHTLSLVIARLGAQSGEELQDLLGVGSEGEAIMRVEAHVGRLAELLVDDLRVA